ncbi:uncharacterized protein A4U43_C04F27810 [Asparagus officinalis]|uniref:Uncharacterized protein n=1 Tax=Asparagus officinalis TaxID=4686 RepID=A0A5P1F4Q6_ASPOF|nr:uncharacterized protein A4U43_C04F27810 [Asparagus officinalis]
MAYFEFQPVENNIIDQSLDPVNLANVEVGKELSDSTSYSQIQVSREKRRISEYQSSKDNRGKATKGGEGCITTIKITRTVPSSYANGKTMSGYNVMHLELTVLREVAGIDKMMGKCCFVMEEGFNQTIEHV